VSGLFAARPNEERTDHDQRDHNRRTVRLRPRRDRRVLDCVEPLTMPTRAQKSAYAAVRLALRECDRRDRFTELRAADRARILTDEERVELNGYIKRGATK